MINTLFLPELREMLADNNHAELSEFCVALHASRTAEFMAGLTSEEISQVFQHTDPDNRSDILSYFDRQKQVEVVSELDRNEAAKLVELLQPDDRVDLLQEVEDDVREELIALMPAEVRRDILRLDQYPEDTAGAMMTTDVTKFSETMSVREAMDALTVQAEDFETIYYLYIVDDENHLRGLVSARQLLTGMRKPTQKLGELMQTDVVAAHVMDDQEEVANKVARMDLLAIPVVDLERRLVGLITHDDVIDVVREEATEDAHRIAAVEPLDQSYLRTSVLTLSWKRGIWLTILFVCALLTAFALEQYESRLKTLYWLVPFIPLIISSGGNSGSQSATLIITALSRKHISVSDWAKVVTRELVMGLLLGVGLATLGLLASWFMINTEPRVIAPEDQPAMEISVDGGETWIANEVGGEVQSRVKQETQSLTHLAFFVVPLTLVLVVMAGTLTGSVLPLIFEKIGLDPAMMSNPFVAGIIDILGIVIYMTVAAWLVGV
ncbi:magnesium transporter [Mariniblastus fucicola]|uniref:Magnesium transporter MgtE n=1 Tax=Mariniblastus fucicola TaxID=980251 RepID=A0A5B9PLD6_9BACT|nr:magnesium transporter [Mariniblastus fucicola]QEG23153.1 Magnesium transporter MgtE [Mariniblastus fucicola]